MAQEYFQTPPPKRTGRAPLMQLTSTSTLTSQAAAITETFSTTQRLHVDLTGRTQVRLSGWITTTGFAGAKVYLQYTPIAAPQTTFADLQTKATGLAMDTVSSTVLQIAPWADIPAAAQTQVVVRLVGVDGNGVASPVVKALEMHFR